jgi:mRNA interferase MazF
MMRGDLYRLRDNPAARGHEQCGARYAVVLQSDSLLGSTVLAAPTSRSARATSYRPEITIDGTVTRVLVEQLTAVDPEKQFGPWAGRLSREEAQQVDQAVRLVLGLFD